MAREFVTLRDGDGPHGLLLPPGQKFYSDNAKTPVDFDGSFLFMDERRMPATGLRMPTDEITGLPHAILPVEDAPGDGAAAKINYHHHFYNRRHPDLEGDRKVTAEVLEYPERLPLAVVAGLAVRMSRGQRLPVNIHNLAHRKYAAGPILPHTIEEKFETAVKACAGIVSRWALDVTPNSRPELVYMNDELFEKVASPKVLCTERAYGDKPADDRRRVLGNFFLRYAASQNLGHIAGRHIDEFLNTADGKRRLALGNYILREAVEVSVAPIMPVYTELKGQGMVQPGRPEPRSMIWKYVHPHRRDGVLPVLEQSLAA